MERYYAQSMLLVNTLKKPTSEMLRQEIIAGHIEAQQFVKMTKAQLFELELQLSKTLHIIQEPESVPVRKDKPTSDDEKEFTDKVLQQMKDEEDRQRKIMEMRKRDQSEIEKRSRTLSMQAVAHKATTSGLIESEIAKEMNPGHTQQPVARNRPQFRIPSTKPGSGALPVLKPTSAIRPSFAIKSILKPPRSISTVNKEGSQIQTSSHAKPVEAPQGKMDSSKLPQSHMTKNVDKIDNPPRVDNPRLVWNPSYSVHPLVWSGSIMKASEAALNMDARHIYGDSLPEDILPKTLQGIGRVSYEQFSTYLFQCQENDTKSVAMIALKPQTPQDEELAQEFADTFRHRRRILALRPSHKTIDMYIVPPCDEEFSPFGSHAPLALVVIWVKSTFRRLKLE
eukprot:TRINITY_DN9189_c0_g2_i2.p1 TRINITY_DN9189_c0_g2~~TRINITY_DN9189_c0_g2_i2.p1  ORF type:complete len:396 (-),score=93.02 TRINITY_DN9189_c0_g2_i2:133-1320(-)